MKSLLTVLALSFASIAFAGTTYTAWPTLGGGVPVNKFCQGPNSIESLDPIKRCVRYESRVVRTGKDREYSNECVEYSYAKLNLPYSYEKTYCADFKTIGHKDNKELVCIEWATKTVKTQVDFEVPVMRKRLGKIGAEQGDDQLYTFSYTIPACQ